MSVYKRHPLSAVYGDLPEDEMGVLVESIKRNGLLRPIVRYHGEILDGWQRFVACGRAKMMPRFEDYHGDDPAGFVEAVNDHRRHDTVAARALAKVKINAWRESGKKSGGSQEPLQVSENIGKSNEQLAREAGVSVSSIKYAKTLVEHGAKATEEAAIAGKIPLRDAAEIAKALPKKEQAAVVKAKKEKKKPKLPKAPPADMVPKADYNKLIDEMNALGDTCNEQARLLQTYEDVRNDKSVAVIMELRTHLKNCQRRRDELMNKSNGDEKVILAMQRKLNKYNGTEKAGG